MECADNITFAFVLQYMLISYLTGDRGSSGKSLAYLVPLLQIRNPGDLALNLEKANIILISPGNTSSFWCCIDRKIFKKSRLYRPPCLVVVTIFSGFERLCMVPLQPSSVLSQVSRICLFDSSRRNVRFRY